MLNACSNAIRASFLACQRVVGWYAPASRFAKRFVKALEAPRLPRARALGGAAPLKRLSQHLLSSIATLAPPADSGEDPACSAKPPSCGIASIPRNSRRQSPPGHCQGSMPWLLRASHGPRAPLAPSPPPPRSSTPGAGRHTRRSPAGSPKGHLK